MRAKNAETQPTFVSADVTLTRETFSRVAVKVERFVLFNFIPVPAPASAHGWLDTTFLDDDVRVSRGHKNNLFVLKQVDASARL
jgi:PAP_fibrillin